MADDLPPEQLAVLRKAFDAFDRERCGSIPCDMVQDILRMMGQPFNKKILEELIDEVDADKSGQIEFDEFVTLAAKFIVEDDAEAMQKELREAFRLYDKQDSAGLIDGALDDVPATLEKIQDRIQNHQVNRKLKVSSPQYIVLGKTFSPDLDGNGYIPTSGLREILRELDDQLTEHELDMMIEEIDSDGSGTVDFDEFMEMMTGE